jgi:hypothetical protein
MRALVTLTYAAEPKERGQLTADCRAFFERIRRQLGRIPLVAVFERGSLHGRWHVHLAINRWINRRRLETLWGHGFVHISGPNATRRKWPVGHLARYLAKYVGKDVDGDAGDERADRADGHHRYLVSQGFTPTRWTWRASHADYSLALAVKVMGEPDAVLSFGEHGASVVWGWWLNWPDP